ncbi:uncharacterized protein B0H18DRAFT_1043827 [Fomitopsis serialis]|uniref:uncharacterized protein n=1 Tax=Fomitopsis serialis TaxID=139415 RepID=UPI0020072A59|nr:uncharacterized protein B0H18DRAFT_1043827 [Neoantrodia serialis]KAH9914950.1 hypothetical protein B0H18DRAFT_1043827 [Neoantrodia serialis]
MSRVRVPKADSSDFVAYIRLVVFLVPSLRCVVYRYGTGSNAPVTTDDSPPPPATLHRLYRIYLTTCRLIGRAIDGKLATFTRKMLVEDGIYMTVLWGARTSDKGAVIGIADHNEANGAPSGFSDRTRRSDWDSTRLWSDWDEWTTAVLDDKPLATLPGLKASKAQPKSAFGVLLPLHADTGLPIPPTVAEIQANASKTVQWWQHLVREFLTVHYAAASNGAKEALPWAKLKRHGSPTCLDSKFWLNDVDFEDPSKIKKANCVRLVRLWRQLQDDEGEDGAFRFHSYVDDVDGDARVVSEEYDAHVARWVEEAPNREAEQQKEAARRQEASGEGDPPSGEQGVGRGPNETAASMRKRRPPVKAPKRGGQPMSKKAKGKRKAADFSEESDSDTDVEAWRAAMGEESSSHGSDAMDRTRTLNSPQEESDESETEIEDAELLPAFAGAKSGAFGGKAPRSISSGQKRVVFLASLSSDRRYTAAVVAYFNAARRLGGRGKRVSGYLPPPLPEAPWASWDWGQSTLPRETHARDDGLAPLLRWLERKPWMAGDVAVLIIVEQVLLAVGMALRDIHCSHFVDDPDEPLPAHIPPFVAQSHLHFTTHESMLALISSIPDASIKDPAAAISGPIFGQDQSKTRGTDNPPSRFNAVGLSGWSLASGDIDSSRLAVDAAAAVVHTSPSPPLMFAPLPPHPDDWPSVPNEADFSELAPEQDAGAPSASADLSAPSSSTGLIQREPEIAATGSPSTGIAIPASKQCEPGGGGEDPAGPEGDTAHVRGAKKPKSSARSAKRPTASGESSGQPRKPPSKKRRVNDVPATIQDGRRSSRLREGGEELRNKQREKTLLAAGRGRRS